MTYHKYTKDNLQPIVNQCLSIRDLLRKLNLQDTGGNNTHLRKVIKKLNINTSHFLGQAIHRGKTFPPKEPLEVYLSNTKKIHSHELKKRLIKEGVFQAKCYNCNNIEWLDNPIMLELHHKDNNHNNNSLENLTILCPNCHALIHKLDRDCHKPRKKLAKKENKNNRIADLIRSGKIDTLYNCKCCQKLTANKHYCSQKCHKQSTRKVKWPPYEQLKKELEESNFSAVGRKYGVSDNAVRKWLKHYENP